MSRAQWECTADDELNKDPVSCALQGRMVDISRPQCLCVFSLVTRFRLNLTQVPLVVDRIALRNTGLSEETATVKLCAVIYIKLEIWLC